MLDLLPAYQGVEPRGIWGNGAEGTLWAVANWTGTMDQKGFVLSKAAGEVSWKAVFQGGVSNAFFRRIFGVDNLLWVGSRRTDRDPLGTYGDGTTSFTLPVTAGDGNQGILPLFDDGVTLYGMLPAAIREGGLGSQLRGPRSAPLVVEGALPARSAPSDAASLPWAPPVIRANLAALWGVKKTGGDLWAAGSEGFITHRTEGRWNARGKLPLAQAPLIYGFWAGRSDDAYAVGEGGQIFHFTDGRWAEESPGDAPRLLGVWGLPGGDVFAVGLGGTILRRQAGTWRKETTPAQQDLFSVWGSGPGDVFAVGAGGVILRWDGDAGGWQVDRSGGDIKLYSVWGVEGDSARWAVGCTGYPTKPIPVALRRTGTSWTAAPITMPMNPAGCMTRVWFSKASEAWVSSYNNGGGEHFRFDRLTGDQTYNRSLSPSCVGFPSGSPILCTGQSGGGLITTNGRNGDPFEFGGAVGDGNWPSNFFILQDDIWSYGVGILHCSKGQVCLSQRR